MRNRAERPKIPGLFANEERLTSVGFECLDLLFYLEYNIVFCVILFFIRWFKMLNIAFYVVIEACYP